MSTFLLPFKGRNSVNAYHQNFLWNHENVYIMDNHRAALWCWLQSMSNDKKYSVYHIDMHYDLSPGIVKRLPENLPDLATITFNEYLSLSRADGGPVPLIIYDNYLSIFEEIYGDRINYFFAATQEVGTPPAGDSSIEEVKIGRLADSIRYNLFDDAISADGWIVNLDLDYFFAQQPKEYRVMFS